MVATGARLVAGIAVILHVGIVVMLVRMEWNSSVWAWNLAIAAAAIVFVGGWRESFTATSGSAGRYAVTAAVLLVLSPGLYYFGRLDAYLCHCLYSANVPTATFFPGIDTPGKPYQMQGADGPYWKNLNVPQPPTHRNFELYFRRVARPGDSLFVDDPRGPPFPADWKHYVWRYTDEGIERISLPQSGLP
ncbi:MAG: hypothetical protein QM775_03350 [Pirellulales bacterium]